MSKRRWALAAVAAVVLAALVPLGRWEGRRQADSQNRGIARLRAAVGRVDSPSLYGYRVLPAFDCLVYRRDGNPYALELCVDFAGRIVEAIDRRRPTRRYYSLRFDRGAATVRVDRGEVDRLLTK